MRFYYKDNKNNKYNCKSERTGLIAITEQEFYSQPKKTLKQLATIQTNAKIFELKKFLNETDYKAIKFAEGLLTAAEYNTTKLQRQEWRAQINALEAQL